MRDHKPISVENLLVRVPLFDGFSPVDIVHFARTTRQIDAPKGTTLFRQGDACNGFHFVIYGQVKLAFMSAQGVEKVVEVVEQGQSFGEAIMFLDKPYVVSAETLIDSLLLHIPKQAIFEALEKDPAIGRKMLAGLARQTHRVMTDIECFSLQSGIQRVIGFFLRELGDEHADGTNQTIKLSIPKGIIASKLNLSQEHFSRILRELADAGLISVKGPKILIPSVRLLAEYES